MQDTGSIIRELRKSAGLSQSTLAKALHITDKAVSKWERGISRPDVSLLPKLALLLDVEVETLISDGPEEQNWVGLIDIDDCDFSRIVYDKPLVYYLLSHFLLLGITTIYVVTGEKNRRYLESEKFARLGFHFFFDPPFDRPVMVIAHPWFLFGSDITQQFRGAMLSGRKTKLVPMNQNPVFYFMNSNEYFSDRKKSMRTASPRTLGRGMVCFDMSDADRILEVASFLKTYQNNSGLLIGSLEEIAFRKGMISAEQLREMAEKVPYGRLLREVAKEESPEG